MPRRVSKNGKKIKRKIQKQTNIEKASEYGIIFQPLGFLT